MILPNDDGHKTTATATASTQGVPSAGSPSAHDGDGDGDGSAGNGGNGNGVVVIGGGSSSSSPKHSTQGSSQLVVYLIDTITGRIIHRVLHPNSSGPVYLVQTENWVVYSYWNQKARRSEMGSVALYEQAVEKYGLNPWTRPEFPSSFSSYSSTSPVVHHKSFIFPMAVKALATSTTIHGITTRHVIVGLTTNQLYSMDLRFLDPRRPAGKPTDVQMAEGLMQYSPYLPLIPTQIVTYNASIANLHSILSVPSAVESTSLVLAYGLDVFYTRVSPSKEFDMLAADFNYSLLILIIVALFAATVTARRVVQRQTLMSQWK